MRLTGQLGDGDRKISIAESSRKNMGATLSHALARIRRDEGVDPDRYPPVKSDIEYDTRRTMIGAEITARETADLILPAIRSTPALTTNSSGSGRAIKALLSLIVALGIASTTLAWLGYQEYILTPTHNNHNIKPEDHNANFDRLKMQNDQIIDLIRENSDTFSKTHVTTASQTLIGKGLAQYVSAITETHITIAIKGRSLVLTHNLTSDEMQQLRTSFGIAIRIK